MRTAALALVLLDCCAKPVVKPDVPIASEVLARENVCIIRVAPTWRPVELSSCDGYAACLSVADDQVLSTDIDELRGWAREVETSCNKAPPGPGAPDQPARVAPATAK